MAEARVLAEEPRLKALVRTLGIDEATLEDVTQDMRRAAAADLFALTDRDGRVTADVSVRPIGESVIGRPGVEIAARDGQASTLWVLGGKDPGVYHVILKVLKFGAEQLGLLVTGYRIDGKVLASARALVGASLLVVAEDRVIAAAFEGSLPPGAARSLGHEPGELEISGAPGHRGRWGLPRGAAFAGPSAGPPRQGAHGPARDRRRRGRGRARHRAGGGAEPVPPHRGAVARQ
jgi:sigma-B regulation protein RsbU (phosphoserine phosphatase)